MSTNVPIASVTLSSAESSVTFADIPQTYTDLVLISNIKGDTGNVGLNYQFNSDTASNYSTTILAGNGTSISSDRYSSQTSAFFTSNYAAGTNDWVTVTSNIQNYSNSTTCKTILSRWSKATGQSTAAVALWRKTPEAISNIKISSIGVNFISGSTFSLYGINAANSAQAKATGGDSIYRDSSYWYHIFNKSGSFIPAENLTNVDYLVIAGGGGGYVQGGGAGGYRTSAGTSGRNSAAESKINLNSQTTYTITVGAGGTAGNSGTTGSNSSISGSGLTTIISLGGGGTSSGGSNGMNGGSGGGAFNSGTPGSGTANQGFDGGSCPTSNAGAGGGGAGSVGGNGSGSYGGNGGDGIASSITGTSVTRAGGGSGYGVSGNGTPGSGGGGNSEATYSGRFGAANTGSGGGGYNAGNGGLGGSGVVIVRYSV